MILNAKTKMKIINYEFVACEANEFATTIT